MSKTVRLILEILRYALAAVLGASGTYAVMG